jgi:hypothetical protein
MQPSSLRSLRLCGESKVARGRPGACVRSAGSPASGLLRRQHPLARRSPLAGDALDFNAEVQRAQRGHGGCSSLLCVLCVSAVNQRSLGAGQALACGPLGRPQAGSYVVSTRRLVGARLRATRWILTQRRRGRRGAVVDAASSLRSLRLCGESKVARGDAALTCSPLSRPQAGSYVVSTRRLVGARLRATRWILTQRRRGRRGAKVDAASSLRSLRPLR